MKIINSTPANKLIVALDVSSVVAAQKLIEQLRGLVGMFKVGSELYSAVGPELVREIVKMGERVFLDLKFHDIPNTVAGAVRAATELGVTLVNVHAAGGLEMMKRAAAAASETAQQVQGTRPAVIAVTLLTSIDSSVLTETGVASSPEAQVQRLAVLAASAGMDGVVASPREVKLIRTAVSRTGFLVVTPGVRPPGAETHDQKRFMTPREAIDAGADYIVVGRPISQASNPQETTREILRQLSS